MELNNIVYDNTELASALTEQLNSESNSFKAIYPSDTATSLVNTLSAYGSMLQYMMVTSLANCYTDTAYSTAGIYQLAHTLGNTLHGNNPAQVRVKIKKKNFLGIDIVIPADTQFSIEGKPFFNVSTILMPANADEVTDIILVQGEKLETTKTSSGIINEKFYFSSDFKSDHNNLEVYINKERWNVAESFLEYDKNYILDDSSLNTVIVRTDPDGKSYIQLGDNRFATLPLSGSEINIKYLSNSGEDGNIPETNKTGSLTSTLVYTDNTGNQANLSVEITTTTTAYGGFSKQSIETLRLTSPYVFASGNRAVRRNDYKALLQNKGGYLTSTVWGEYEEADQKGIYDSLMMNMVYYTGIKSYENYPYFNLGYIENNDLYEGSVATSYGFWGSFSFRILNEKTNEFVLLQDNGAQGILFINNNQDDPRDSLLPDWLTNTSAEFKVTVPEDSIVDTGNSYRLGDELVVDDTEGTILIKVMQVDSRGSVLRIQVVTPTSEKNYNEFKSTPYSATYLDPNGNLGEGLRFNLSFVESYNSNLITTNDDRGIIPAPVHTNSIENAKSNAPDTSYYQSLWSPSLLQPVQIILNYGDEQKSITGIKFQASDPVNGPFIATVAMFGTNISPMPSLENVRNNDAWDKLIDRTYLNNPHGNANENWTDWLPTNCFTGSIDNLSKPIYNTYRYYVIEIYSCDNVEDNQTPLVTFNKIKMLYSNDSSIIYYQNNGELNINFPTVGSPGPGNENGYLTSDLLNNDKYPQYAYTTKIDGVTYANGYRNGNILAYVYKNGDTEMSFIIKVLDVDNNTYSVALNNNTVLVGTTEINISDPASLDTFLVYTISLINEGRVTVGNGGSGYKPNDIVTLDNTNGQMSVKVITTTDTGEVTNVTLVNNISIANAYEGEFTTIGGNGTGLKVELTSSLSSGTEGVAGSGGTLTITSNNNLAVTASFVGNRIDDQDIAYLDQPIINQYNHFTTRLEFKQPEIIQVGVSLDVSVSATASRTSGMIIQDVRNNITNMFNITPDYIGKGLKLSDLYVTVMNTPDVVWCKIKEPFDNLDILPYQLMTISYINITESVDTFK